MSHADLSVQAEGAAPPHPFRAAAWYDPRVEHQPCQCPKCREERDAPGPPRLMVGRIVLVVLGGVLLPLVSLAVNADVKVVASGPAGHIPVIVAVLATLANLVLSPRRRERAPRVRGLGGWHGRIVHAPPRSTTLRVLLLAGALWSCLIWGYFALLFVPLIPLSVVAIIFMGIGLCGLCPFIALAISVIQARHAYRAVAERLSRRVVLAITCTTLLLPVLVSGGVATYSRARQATVERAVDRIIAAAPYSHERMAAIEALSGAEEWLARSYVGSHDPTRHEALAEAYLRLTDEPIHDAVQKRLGPRRHGGGAIRPWWFLELGEMGSPVDLEAVGRF